MLAVEGLAEHSAQVVPNGCAVERVGEGLLWGAGVKAVFHFGDLEGNAAGCGVAVEGFGEGFTWGTISTTWRA